MRVLVDTNLFVSFLLHPDRDTAANQVVRAAVAGRFELLLPGELLDELVARAHQKPYLASRIEAVDLGELVAILQTIGEVLPKLEQPPPRVTRDDNDDYLLAHAAMAGADVLVTGDSDLLDLHRVGDLRILTAGGLMSLLDRVHASAGEGAER